VHIYICFIFYEGIKIQLRLLKPKKDIERNIQFISYFFYKR
jgi:hypothetical protein